MAWCTRAVILPLIALGALFNLYILYSILTLWSNLRRDAESEWEGGGHNTVRSFAAFMVTYILLASTASAIGFMGVYKRIPSYVRLFLQFTFADFAVYALSLIIVAFACYRPSEWRETSCEELSTQPDLLRSLAQAGFNLENCETWIEKLVLGALTLLSVGLILKLQFVLAVATYYTSLARVTGHHPSVFSSSRGLPHRGSVSRRDRHVLLVPSRESRAVDLPPYSDGPAVYAPVTNLSAEDARALNAKEAVVSMYEMEEQTRDDEVSRADSKRRA